MGYFQDTRTCDEHGFVLSPEGTCVRCVKDQARREKRRGIAKLATGVTVVVASLLGFGAARARIRTQEPAEVAAAPVAAPVTPIRVAAPEPALAPQGPAVQASGDWDQAMARAEAERQRLAALQAAAEKQREVAALTIPTPPPEREPTAREDVPSETVDPAFAHGYRAQTRVRRTAAGVVPVGGVNGTMNSPSAWGLPVNNGGNFGNHRGSH